VAREKRHLTRGAAPVNDEDKRKHLEFIQAAVTRMASNLFYLKGWTVTLIAGVFVLSAKDSNPNYFAIAYLGAILFWVLDGYFLGQERSFRALYDHVRILDPEKIDYSMDTSQFAKETRNSWYGAMFSRTLLIYYGGLVGIMITVAMALTEKCPHG
jgi:hypothetical protein